eukprot:1920593-Amphidinium_carterae.1
MELATEAVRSTLDESFAKWHCKKVRSTNCKRTTHLASSHACSLRCLRMRLYPSAPCGYLPSTWHRCLCHTYKPCEYVRVQGTRAHTHEHAHTEYWSDLIPLQSGCEATALLPMAGSQFVVFYSEHVLKDSRATG